MTMRSIFLAFCALLLAGATAVQTAAQTAAATTPDRTDAILDGHVLPGMQALSASAQALAAAAGSDCAAGSEDLRAAYQATFDAWMAVSHLRFGPAETDARGFALAFWPDTRGATPKTLARLIADADPVVETPEAFATVSVAGRGIYALEFLLYDPNFAQAGSAAYRCALIRAVATDIARTAAALAGDWTGRYGALMRDPGPSSAYQSEDEVLQEFFKALTTGLEVDAELRLGRPMGTIDRPRPARAEARRSGRSLRNVTLSLRALQDLSRLLSAGDPALAEKMERAFAHALDRAEKLDDPVFAGVATPQGRLRVEVLQQAVEAIRVAANEYMGPSLGVAAGFNSLDGD